MKLKKYPKHIWESLLNTPEYSTYLWNKYIKGGRITSPPTFVVGCGHSGTSILLAILGAHPNIFPVPGETHVAVKGKKKKFKHALKKFNRMTIAAGKNRWAEKTPKHIMHIGQILEWEPNAQFIIILRDGRDVTYSIKQRTDSIEEGIKRWKDENIEGEKYWELPNVHVLKYEDLITDFEPTMTKVLNFMGEEYDECVKNYHQTPKQWFSKNISKPSSAKGDQHGELRNWQINQPLFDGRGKWKKLTDDELAYIQEYAGPMLNDYGYTGDLVKEKPSN